MSGNDVAYILFTSGSTGRPKGVAITADNIENFCRGVSRLFPFGKGVMLNQVSYSFDVSGCSLYAGLGLGMTLFTVDKAMSADYRELFSALGQSGLCMWVSTPSFTEICIKSNMFDASLLPKLRTFLFCGEVLTHFLCDELASRFSSAEVINTYGPTEATVLVTETVISSDMRSDSRSIPIGRAIEGVELRLLSEDGEILDSDGALGELLILGKSVGPGYWGAPELSQKSFFKDGKTGLLGYKTGDICHKYGGLYYYCGRKDNQLKLNGFRLEIEDIERNLQKIDGISRAVVIPVSDGEKVSFLSAFLLLSAAADDKSKIKKSDIKRKAASYLPDYMIPRKLFILDSFPLNTNGKVDRAALKRTFLEGVV